jgi:hypothetical protein
MAEGLYLISGKWMASIIAKLSVLLVAFEVDYTSPYVARRSVKRAPASIEVLAAEVNA